jgi:UDP-glucose 4-epimerase
MLGWIPKYSLEDIMRSAWQWEQKLKTDEQFFTGTNFQLN